MAGQVITIAQQKGGSGKTTIAANLALAFASRNRSTAILDTDPQGSLGRWFMTRKEDTGEEGPEIGFRTASAWGARYEARELLKNHELVIIDTPPKMGVDGRPSIEVADLVLVPMAPSPVDFWATEPTIAMAKNEKKPILIVLNRAAPRTRINAEIRELVNEFECDVADTHIGNRVLFAETAGLGVGVIEKRPSSPAAEEIRALTDEVATLLAALKS